MKKAGSATKPTSAQLKATVKLSTDQYLRSRAEDGGNPLYTLKLNNTFGSDRRQKKA